LLRVRTIAWLLGVAALSLAAIAIVSASILLLPPILVVPLVVGVLGFYGWAVARRGKPYESEHGPEDTRRADDGYRGPHEETGAGWL